MSDNQLNKRPISSRGMPFVIPVILFFFALFLRTAAIILLPDLVSVAPDKTHRYDPIAESILSGQGFGIAGNPTAIAGPVYPVFLAIVYSVFGFGVTRLRLVLAALDAGQCVISYLIALRYFDRRVALITGVLLAVCPYFLFAVYVCTTETMFLFLNTLFLLTFSRATELRTRRSYFIAGIACGFTTLCRATSLLLPLFLIPTFVVNGRKNLLPGFNCFLLFLLGVLVTIGPWTYRNYIVFGKLVPIQTLGGYHLYLATGQKKVPGRSVGAVANDREYFNRAWSSIESHPLDYAGRMFDRFWKMWSKTDSGKQDRVLGVVNLSLLVAALFGMWIHRSRWKELLPLELIIFNYVAVHVVVIAIFRYLLPTIPVLVMFAVAAVFWFVPKRLESGPAPGEPGRRGGHL